METIMNQLFSPELIPDYMHAHPEYGVKRILTYTVYRFLSFAGKEDDTLAAYSKWVIFHKLCYSYNCCFWIIAAYIKETLFPMEDALDFSLISDYLALDPYFCPIPEEDSFDAFFLYTAISILENAFDEFALGDELAIIDDLILTKYPVLGSVAILWALVASTFLIESCILASVYIRNSLLISRSHGCCKVPAFLRSVSA